MQDNSTSTFGMVAAVFLILALLSLIITCCYRNKINLSIAVLKVMDIGKKS